MRRHIKKNLYEVGSFFNLEHDFFFVNFIGKLICTDCYLFILLYHTPFKPKKSSKLATFSLTFGGGNVKNLVSSVAVYF